MTDERDEIMPAEEAAEEVIAETAEETVAAEAEEVELPKLDDTALQAAVEAILFAFGHSVEISRIAWAVGETEEKIDEVLTALEAAYGAADRGIVLQRLEKKVQLTTKKDYYPQLIRLAANPKKPALTQTVLETLSIVAYKQPVTRGDVERIRGVKCDFAINKLVEYGLIEEVGRLDAPGRPILFATTEEFLRRYGMNSISNLPQASAEEIESFVTEATDEIPI